MKEGFYDVDEHLKRYDIERYVFFPSKDYIIKHPKSVTQIIDIL